MTNYKALVKSEASKFFEETHAEFLEDDGEHGGKSADPNFLKWVDRSEKLNSVVEKVVSTWGLKEFQWVKTSTRSPAPAGGDPRSNAFGSFYSDILHEIKKLKKKAAPS